MSLNKTPICVKQCNNCGGSIWRQDQWFQCIKCGALSTAYGGLFTHVTVPNAEFKAAVLAVCHKQISKLYT